MFGMRRSHWIVAGVVVEAYFLWGCAWHDEARLFEDWMTDDSVGMSFSEAERVSGRPNPSVEPLPDHATLEDYLAYASRHNPNLQAARLHWQAARWRIPQKQSLPDPRIRYRYFIENVETRVGPQRQSIGLSQKLPWFGKLEIHRQMATQGAAEAEARYQTEKTRLFYEVKKTYYEYYFLTRAIEVVRENLELVTYLEKVARTRFKTAEAGHPDVIRSQVELGRLDDQLRTLRDFRGSTMAHLNAILNRPSSAFLPEPRSIQDHDIVITESQCIELLQRNNPQLAALRHTILTKRHQMRLARKDNYPDLTFSVDYVDTGEAVAPGVSDSGNDPISVGVSVNVPLWHDKQEAMMREALAEFGAATKRRIDKENRLKAQLKEAFYGFHDAERKIDLYRDTLVPKAKQAIKATEGSFRSGTASFMELMDAERVLLEFQLAYERALTDQGIHLAEIEMLLGRSLTHRTDPVRSIEDRRPTVSPLSGESQP